MSYWHRAVGEWWPGASIACLTSSPRSWTATKARGGGGRRAVLEYDLAGFGAGTMSFLGNKAKPLLAPLALRAAPLPLGARLALGGGLIAAAALVAGLFRRD
jgi:hypothetical protein